MAEKIGEKGVSRRDFLKGAVVVAAASGGLVPVVRIARAAGNNTPTAVNTEFPGTELLGRPTNHSITVNLVGDTAIEAYAEYGPTSGTYIHKTAVATAEANAPLEILMDGLSPNSRYYYRLVYREKGTTGAFQPRPEYSFHTPRSLTDAFVFTVISDSHLGRRNFNNPALYTIACQNVQNDHPDLHFDLGDAFTLTNLNTGDLAGVRKAYMAQRPYMGLFAHSTPLFLAIGNHEEEEGWNLDDAGDAVSESKPIMGINTRKLYYPNPIPNDFYTGDTDTSQKEISGDHLKEDYFSFEWGCALFVVLDPFWYTKEKPFLGAVGGENTDDDMPEADRWRWTLGKEQYDWLKKTLEQSSAKYKFVLAHQVAGGGGDKSQGSIPGSGMPNGTGGAGGQGGTPPNGGMQGNASGQGGNFPNGGMQGGVGGPGGNPPNGGEPGAGDGAGGGDYGRGGELATHGYEWGADAADFAANRPGWSSTKSVHQLFIDNGVDVFFHGHDHVFATEKVDGMIYQECPFPANDSYGTGFSYYKNDPPKTVVKPNSGHIRVTVTPEKATVDYVRAFLPGDGTNGHIEHSYDIEKKA